MDPRFVEDYKNAIRYIARHGTPGMRRSELVDDSDVEIASGVFNVPQLTVAKDIIAVRAGEELEF